MFPSKAVERQSQSLNIEPGCIKVLDTFRSAELEREHIQPEQEARFEVDAWEQAVSFWLMAKTQTTILVVAREALFIDLPKIGTADQRRIAAILERLGWARGGRTTAGRPWVKKA